MFICDYGCSIISLPGYNALVTGGVFRAAPCKHVIHESLRAGRSLTNHNSVPRRQNHEATRCREPVCFIQHEIGYPAQGTDLHLLGLYGIGHGGVRFHDAEESVATEVAASLVTWSRQPAPTSGFSGRLLRRCHAGHRRRQLLGRLIAR